MVEKAFSEMKEILARIDERVKSLVDSHISLTGRFDKFLQQHTDLVQRVASLETSLNSIRKIEDNFSSILNRLGSVEFTAEIIETLEEELNKLEERVSELEMTSKNQNYKWESWSNKVFWVGEIAFKTCWVLGMAWLLYKFGLGGANFPP